MLGYGLALGCALIWSISIIIFKIAEDRIDPIFLNLLKNSLGFLLMIPTLFFVDGAFDVVPTGREVALLMLSGFLGIGIADFLVLKCLQLVGATRLAIVECLYSPSVIALSMLFLGEVLTGLQAVGSMCVLSAIVLVNYKSLDHPVAARRLLFGTLYGASGIIFMAIGIVLVKPIFETVNLFAVIEIRLAAGVAASLVLWLASGRAISMWDGFAASPRKGLILTGCFLSTYVAMIMWVAGFKFNDASIAAILNQTSTIFTVVLSVLILKERLTMIKVSGTMLALLGVVLMTN